MANEIIFKEGDLHEVRITVPAELDMSGKKVKIQVRREPDSTPILSYTTESATYPLTVINQYIYWTIDGGLTIGKNGVYEWEIVIYTTTTDQRRYARGTFEIIPSIVEL